MANTVLHVTGLCFGYPGQAALLSSLDCTLKAGVTLLQGGEARGKTTLLKLLAADMAPDAGHICLANIARSRASDSLRSQVFRTDPRSDALDQISASQFFNDLKQHYPGFDLRVAQELAAGLSLTEHLEKPLFMLSTGSKRKVWLAAAFAAGTTVTLLDEPFAALDHRSADFVLDVLREVSQHGNRAWVVADYAAPQGVMLAGVIDLGG